MAQSTSATRTNSAPPPAMVSMRPSTFTQGGGLIDDVDVEITRARFALYDYEGKSDEPGLVLGLTLKDPDGNEHIQYYSAGDKAYFVPNEDPKDEDNSGKYLVKVGDRDALNGGTNTALLINSMINAGVPEDLFDGDMTAIEGLGVHMNQQAQPKRSGLPKRVGQDKDREKTILLATRLNYLPGEGQAAKPAAATKAPAKAAPARAATAGNKPAPAVTLPAATAAPADEMVEELQGHLVGAFAANNLTELKKSQIATTLFKVIDKADPNRNKLLQMAGKDDVLSSLDMFSFDGKTLTQNQD